SCHRWWRGEHVLAIGIVVPVAEETDEIHIRPAGSLVVEIGERVIQQRLLRGQHRLRRRIRIAAIPRPPPRPPPTRWRATKTEKKPRGDRRAPPPPPMRATRDIARRVQPRPRARAR